MRLRHFVPLGFVLSIIGLGIGGVFWWPIWLLLAAELLLYTAVGGLMAVRAAPQESAASAVLILLAFVQLHIAYGIGSLWGALTAPLRFGFSRRAQPAKALPGRRN